MSVKFRKSRRIATLALGCALTIGLTSCGASDNTGKIKSNEVYAQAGDFKVYNKDLWNEFKWQSNSVLETQMTNVVLKKYTDNITNVIDKDYSSLTSSEKKNLGLKDENDQDAFDKLKKKYQERLVDLVIQDIYNFTYQSTDYEDSFEKFDEKMKRDLELTYVKEMYKAYKIEANDNLLKDIYNEGKPESLIDNPYTDGNTDMYLAIATAPKTREAYFLEYGKELLAYAKLQDEIDDAEDDDDDDDKLGYFVKNDLSATFRSKYYYKYGLDALIVKFKDDEEYSKTLRAFGVFQDTVKNKGKFYFVADSNTGAPSISLSYRDYVARFDEIVSDSNKRDISDGVYELSTGAVLELYVQLYNYVYAGYRDELKTNVNGNAFNVSGKKLDDLRAVTLEMNEYYASHEDDIDTAIATLKALDTNQYSSEDLNDINAPLATQIYEYDENDRDACYATSLISGNYIAYKLDKREFTEDELADFTVDIKTITTFLETDENGERTIEDKATYEIIDYLLQEGHESILEDVKKDIIEEEITSFGWDKYLEKEVKKVKVKIYNEACELSYANSHSNYDKTVIGNDDDNVLADIKYDGKTYHLNIKANDKDSKSIKKIGSNEAFGVFDFFEEAQGQATAVNLLTDKIVKTTPEYKVDSKKFAKDYENMIETMLLYFTRGGYESSGYPASIGKYKFMMLYFHSADIDTIVNNTYRVQYAKAELLADFSNDKLVKFFKKYTDYAYDKYFSMSSTILTVVFDRDDDGDTDDVTDWRDDVVTFNFGSGNVTTTRGVVAKDLIFQVNAEISCSTSSHTEALADIVDEINNSAKFEYLDNPIQPESKWAKYRRLGLSVESNDVTYQNSSCEETNMKIKQRLFDYAQGSNEDGTKIYQYFINKTTPSCYIEPLYNREEVIKMTDETIIESEKGYNLILVTAGEVKKTAEWTEKDNDQKVLEDLVLFYNKKLVSISDVYNEEADENGDFKLNENQIKLYLLDQAINAGEKFVPTNISQTYGAYLSGAYNKFNSAATQRLILLSFINNNTTKAANMYDIIKFANNDYNGATGIFAKLLKNEQDIEDGNKSIYEDTTGTLDLYNFDGTTWWNEIMAIMGDILQGGTK